MKSQLKFAAFAAVVFVLASQLSFAQEETSNQASESGERSVAEASEETPSESTGSAPSEEPQQDPVMSEGVAPEADCASIFVNYVRTLPAAKQANEFEPYWALSSSLYEYTQLDEFKRKEETPAKKAEFESKLKGEAPVMHVYSDVILGQYDFKKKGFPVTYFVDQKGLLANQRSGKSKPEAGMPITAMCSAAANKLPAKHSAPSWVLFKITNLSKFAFFPVAEDKAKEITSNLGSARNTRMIFIIKDGKPKMIPMGKSKNIEMEAPALAAHLGRGDNFSVMKP